MVHVCANWVMMVLLQRSSMRLYGLKQNARCPSFGCSFAHGRNCLMPLKHLGDSVDATWQGSDPRAHPLALPQLILDMLSPFQVQ